MPQCITSQCVKPAGQRADEREGVGEAHGLHVLEVGGNCDMDRCQGVNRANRKNERKRDKEEGWSVEVSECVRLHVYVAQNFLSWGQTLTHE